MKQMLERIIPYLIVGIAIAVFVLMLIILSYIVLWGLLIGAILFAVTYVKNRFFQKKSVEKWDSVRIIEYEDIEKHIEKE